MAVVLYGVAIHRAIASGDKKRMRSVAKEAEAYLAQYGDLGASVTLLKAELAKLGESIFSGPIVLYGVVMQQAIASGDIEKMKSVAKQAEEHLEEYGDVRGALSELKAAIARQ